MLEKALGQVKVDPDWTSLIRTKSRVFKIIHFSNIFSVLLSLINSAHFEVMNMRDITISMGIGFD
jgi:hypothetical protein